MHAASLLAQPGRLLWWGHGRVQFGILLLPTSRPVPPILYNIYLSHSTTARCRARTKIERKYLKSNSIVFYILSDRIRIFVSDFIIFVFAFIFVFQIKK
jgi:hypothetical protein